jgi:hypothetical protein
VILQGLEIAPSQVWGTIRIVPLIRRKVREDLRLIQRSYNEDMSIVSLERDMKYFSYIPHGLVMSWTDDGSAVVNLGGDIRKADGKQLNTQLNNSSKGIRQLHRMVKKESKNQLRFLPLHLAMEGFLSLFFNGPDIPWQEYSSFTISNGLGSRYEYSFTGNSINGLEDAFRVFEIHEGQVGILLYVAESLASAFVVPTPQDFRALYSSLLEDFYGELIDQYALMHETTYPMELHIDESKINNLADLRNGIFKMRKDWASFQNVMADGLLDKELNSKTVYTAGQFRLQRFITPVGLKDENHIGELILRDNGELEYLHTYRLSGPQARRVYYLSKLNENNWDLNKTAKKLSYTEEEFVYLMEKVGFGYLFRQQLRDKAIKAKKMTRKANRSGNYKK